MFVGLHLFVDSRPNAYSDCDNPTLATPTERSLIFQK